MVGDPRTLMHSTHWADWLGWIERTGSVCAPPRWLAPARPRVRVREEAEDEAEEEVDDLGRTLRSERRDGGADGAQSTSAPSRAAKREERKRRRLAATAAADSAMRASAADAAEAAAAATPRLLPNWFRATDGEGRAYYHNAATEETCWEAPLGAVRVVADVAAEEARDAEEEMRRLHTAWLRDGEETPPPG